MSDLELVDYDYDRGKCPMAASVPDATLDVEHRDLSHRGGTFILVGPAPVSERTDNEDASPGIPPVHSNVKRTPASSMTGLDLREQPKMLWGFEYATLTSFDDVIPDFLRLTTTILSFSRAQGLQRPSLASSLLHDRRGTESSLRASQWPRRRCAFGPTSSPWLT